MNNKLITKPYFKIGDVKENIYDISFLNETEKKEFSTLKYEKRKIEWLSSRKTAKELISQTLNIELKDIEIYNDSNRRPYAKIQNYSKYNLKGKDYFNISISHRDKFCACAFNHDFSPYIGIDIERYDDIETNLLSDYLTLEEIRYANNNRKKIISIWSKKEAFFKMLGLGLSIDTRDIEIIGKNIKTKGNILNKIEGLNLTKIQEENIEMGNYIISILWIV